eukprot:COSAG01_NODE_40392_length_464_cov_0.928767_1_plen_51_part_10
MIHATKRVLHNEADTQRFAQAAPERADPVVDQGPEADANDDDWSPPPPCSA